MKFLLFATPLIGHVNPVMNIGRLLVQAGHDVVFSSAPAFKQQAEANGMQFVEAPPAAAQDLSDMDAVFPERKLLPAGPEQIFFDVTRLFCDPVEARYRAILSMLESFPADAVLIDNFNGGSLPFLLKQEERPLMVHVGISAFFYRRDDFAPFGPGLPPVDPASPEAEQYKEIAKQVDAVAWGPAGVYLNDLLRKMGAEPLPMPFLDAVNMLPDLYLHPGAPSIELPRKDMTPNVHFVGVFPSLTDGVLPAAVEEKIATGKPLIVVTQGTVVNHDSSALLEPALAAFADRDDVVVIATTGGRNVPLLHAPVPANATVVQYLPMDELMKHAAVLVTNGGYGTVCRAMALGVPMVVAGKSEDKAEVAMLIEHAGLGINLHTDRPEPTAIAEAVDAVLTSDAFREKAFAVAAELTAIDTGAKVVSLLENAVKARQEAAVSA